MSGSYRRMLLVYPEFAPTYWGMQYALQLIGAKSLMPPLGLITVAALTPPGYEFRLVDLNCDPLTAADLAWADVVLFSAMLPQKHALFRAAAQCRRAGKLVVFGGPYPTACPEECRPHCDVLVLNEGEVTWPLFLNDLEQGALKARYTSAEKPDVTKTPCPRFDLLKIHDYEIIPIQFSRGCPFECEFCDIIVMFGRLPRTKTPAQLLRELDALYRVGFRGEVFIVDDNFIGNRRAALTLLPEVRMWNEAHGYPFNYFTEASVNLADHEDLLRELVEARFHSVFIGLESPSADSLVETKKLQNVRSALSLEERVETIERAGLIVQGGFIVGFDHDTEDIFDRQIRFISDLAIPNAMVGPLTALPGTPLYKRMREAGRLLESVDSDQDPTIASGFTTNLIPVMPLETLLKGHCKILTTLYTPRRYFQRTLEAFARLPRPASFRGKVAVFLEGCRVLFAANKTTSRRPESVWQQCVAFVLFCARFFSQISSSFQWEAIRFAALMVLKRPERSPWIFRYATMGYHGYRFTFDDVVPSVNRYRAELPEGHATTLSRAMTESVPVAASAALAEG